MTQDKYHRHFGVYAIIASEDHSKILLIKKIRGPYSGLLDLPGGSVENSETLEHALHREIKEEIGCKIIDSYQKRTELVLYNYTKDQQLYTLQHIGVLYDVKVMGQPKTQGDGKDCGGTVWLKISKISPKNSTPLANISAKLIEQKCNII